MRFLESLSGFADFDFALGVGDVDGFGDAQEFQDFERDPGNVELVPGQAVAGGGGVGMVIIMPAFAEGEEGDPPVVSGIVAGFEAA